MRIRIGMVGATLFLGMILACGLGGCGLGDIAGESSAQESAVPDEPSMAATSQTESAGETEMMTEIASADVAAEIETDAAQAAAGSESETPENTDSPDGEDRVQVPDFPMTLLDGTKVHFSDYEGKKILLNFWATWCGPCVGEMPAFQRLAEEYPEELTILAVNCAETQGEVQRFIEKNDYTFPVVLDEDGAIAYLFGGIDSIPVTVVIDEEGCLITASTGASDADAMYEEYKEMLGF